MDLSPGDDQVNIARVPRYATVDLIGDLDPPRVWIGRTPDGHFWACKQVDQYQLFSECLGYRLAEVFDVHTPGFAVSLGANNFWLSSLVDPASHCDPSRADEITNYPSIGRLLILDLVIGAFDRHERNLLIDREKDVRAWAIDFEKSYLSQPGTFDVNTRFDPMQGYLSLPTEMYVPHARLFTPDAIETVKLHGLSVITECENLAALGVSCNGVARDLVDRSQILPELLRDFEDKLP